MVRCLIKLKKGYIHTFQSEHTGFDYLFGVGIPSFLSAKGSYHKTKLYENNLIVGRVGILIDVIQVV